MAGWEGPGLDAISLYQGPRLGWHCQFPMQRKEGRMDGWMDGEVRILGTIGKDRGERKRCYVDVDQNGRTIVKIGRYYCGGGGCSRSRYL